MNKNFKNSIKNKNFKNKNQGANKNKKFPSKNNNSNNSNNNKMQYSKKHNNLLENNNEPEINEEDEEIDIEQFEEDNDSSIKTESEGAMHSSEEDDNYNDNEENFEEQKTNQKNKFNKNNDDDEEINSDSHSDSDSEAEIYNRKNSLDENSKNPEEDFLSPVLKEDKQEFTNLLNNMRSSISEVDKKMNSILSNFSLQDKAEIKFGISYLDAKNNFMLIYLTNLLTYSLNKLNGKLIKKNPILKQMTYLKTVLEKTKVIDIKLKTQIDRLLKLGEKNIEEGEAKTKSIKKEEIDENNFRPRILDDENVSENENENNSEEENKKAKYKVKKDLQQEFFETQTENKKRLKSIEKTREKVRNSELYKDMREEFNDNPYEYTNNDTEFNKYMKQKEDIEEDEFRRIKVSKAEMKKLRKMDSKDNDFSNIGKDFKNLENLLNYNEKEEFESEMKFTSRKRAMGSTARGGSRGSRGSSRGGRTEFNSDRGGKSGSSVRGGHHKKPNKSMNNKFGSRKFKK